VRLKLIAVATLEHQIALHQLTQQTLKNQCRWPLSLLAAVSGRKLHVLLRQSATEYRALLVTQAPDRRYSKFPASAMLVFGILLNRQAEATRSIQQTVLRELETGTGNVWSYRWRCTDHPTASATA
jgi:hypothetical protein